MASRSADPAVPVGRTRSAQVLTYALLVLFSIFFLVPLLWAVLASLKSPAELQQYPHPLLPRDWRWSNWLDVWTVIPLGRFFINTITITVLALAGQLLSCSLVAYGFARFRFPFRRLLFSVVIAVLILPGISSLIPQYVIYTRLGWLDTFLPLIVPWWLAAGSGSAFSIFLLRQFYANIPRELEEAAVLDGASHLRVWWSIILPLSRPALGAVAVLGFIWHWTEFLGPLIYLQSQDKFTLTLGLRFLQTGAADTTVVSQSTDQYLMVATLLACLPPLLLFLFAQRHFIQGINLSGGKG
jgi:multiple sugar transport system permease protein